MKRPTPGARQGPLSGDDEHQADELVDELATTSWPDPRRPPPGRARYGPFGELSVA
jgi:hypothetical protein